MCLTMYEKGWREFLADIAPRQFCFDFKHACEGKKLTVLIKPGRL